VYILNILFIVNQQKASQVKREGKAFYPRGTVHTKTLRRAQKSSFSKNQQPSELNGPMN
jgi:hypothetical protein